MRITVPSDNRSLTPKFVIGACLVLMGVVLALEQLGILEAHHLLRFWPAALIVIGLVMLQRTEKHSALRALLLIVIGAQLFCGMQNGVVLDR